MVVLDEAVVAGAREVRGVHVEHADRLDVQAGLLVHLPAQRVARLLPVLDPTAGEGPAARDAGPRGHPCEQDLGGLPEPRTRTAYAAIR